MYDLSARNPFINVKSEHLHLTDSSVGIPLKNVFQKAQFYKTEFDLDTTLEIVLFLKWKEPQKDNFYLSPLLFKPIKIKRNRKLSDQFDILRDHEAPFLSNPILEHSFSRHYDLYLPEEVQNIDTFIENIAQQLNTKDQQIQNVVDFDSLEQWQIIRKTCIGNFNYKKSLLGKDYHSIISQPSEQIQLLLNGDSPATTLNSEPLTPILDLDFSQQETILKSMLGNLVVQGPPGTGKSHTIVGMIGNFLAQGKRVLFVSQKKSALEVVYSRLKEFGLNHLAAFLNTEKDEKKEFYNSLRKNWDKISDQKIQLETPEPIEAGLIDFYLNEYQRFNEKLGSSIHEALKALGSAEFNPLELPFTGTLPAPGEWQKQLDFLISFEKKLNEIFQITRFSEAGFTLLNKAVFKESDPIFTLNKRLNELQQILNEIKSTAVPVQDHNLRTYFDFALAASILNMVNHTQLDLLDKDSKSYTKFSNWARKYELLKSKVERTEQANKAWKNKPSKSEITELIDLLKHHHAPKGILGLLKRRNDKLDQAFKDFSPDLSDIAKQQLLEELRNEWNLKAELEELKIKLKHHFNISTPENEINHIMQLRNKLNDISEVAYLKILESENSLELIRIFSNLHPKIQRFNNISRFIFHDTPPDNLDELEFKITLLQEQLHQYKILLPELQHYFQLPFDVRDLIGKTRYSVHQLNTIILYHNLIEQTRFEPAFDELSGKSLEDHLSKISKKTAENFRRNRNQVRLNFQRRRQQLENLINTPASKLNDHQKKQKVHLRQIKKLMVHEMSKKQRHLSLKEFTKHTWEYLAAIYPVWIMNPLSVSERLSCKKNLFDVVIFDESSQIPLEDAIPAIYRAKQVIVVGDHQQMPPSAFFTTNQDSLTLLDKADLAYPKHMLKWHYRSNYPQLIQFSNEQFYDNELLTIPPTDTAIPFQFVKVNGIFESGFNTAEAAEISSYLKKLNPDPREIGIIAFSKDQENLIRDTLISKKLFHEDLLIRNLENVQGIERDHIIISIGYGPDPHGTFKLNFGPVNQQNGPNRLNVLFSRAKKKITIFSSVTATDFRLSDNSGVNCLKDFLHYAENLSSAKAKKSDQHATKKVTYYTHSDGSSINCYIQHETGKVLLIDPCTGEYESKDLYTIYKLLQQRFKEVKILLMKDKWTNKDAFDKMVDLYFQ